MLARAGLAVAAVLTVTSAMAGSASGAFSVIVNLSGATNPSVPASGICVSQALSAGTGAEVRVACQSGQFVDISPLPGRPFVDVHGGAYRFKFGAGAALEGQFDGSLDALLGTGTITAMRIYHAERDDGPLEMLVSF